MRCCNFIVVDFFLILFLQLHETRSVMNIYICMTAVVRNFPERPVDSVIKQYDF